ncbi:calmodulin-binding protein 60 G isoform X2 [Cucumis sativus]|uniref:calmodulin-binding protein 60 G isoform X2 n=1 Tax=Cucumis sativus TaxID=3659 RepID=UPI0005EC7F1B|nr:calmodulin-binding protein 60 G isoform X2 [Cucumis sativus]
MDPIAAAKNKKKRTFSYEATSNVQDDSVAHHPASFTFPTRIDAMCKSIVEDAVTRSRSQMEEPRIGEVVKRFYDEIWPKVENDFRQQVFKEVQRMIHSAIHSAISPSLSIQHRSEQEEILKPSKTLKRRLFFLNSFPSVIFTNNEIKSEDGEPLKVAICDTTNCNSIVSTSPLSSVQVELCILPGEFDSSNRRDEETPWTSSYFNTSILTPRDGKRPLIIGNDRQVYLKDGVGFINNLIITDNSSWMKSKKFRLGAKITDERIPAGFGRIGEAVSQPFRVMDQRGEVNQKHHPPRMDDEVWRLEGIAKYGIYHKNLSSQGIKTVGDFLKAYHQNNNPNTLRTMLGKRVLDKTWKMMVQNAEECVVPIDNNQIVQANGPVKFNHVMDDSAIKDFGLMSDFIEWPDVTEEFFLPVQAEASNICEVDDETQYQKLQIKVRPKPK